jgi:hypothetical protein
MSVLPADAYPALDCTNGEWQKHSIEFTVLEGKTSVTLSLYRWPTKNLYFDNFVLKEKETSTAAGKNMFVEEKDFYIYPNPVNDVLNIRHSNKNDNVVEIAVFNLHGELMMVFKEDSRINVSALAPGIYFVKAGRQVLKFIKK